MLVLTDLVLINRHLSSGTEYLSTLKIYQHAIIPFPHAWRPNPTMFTLKQDHNYTKPNHQNLPRFLSMVQQTSLQTTTIKESRELKLLQKYIPNGSTQTSLNQTVNPHTANVPAPKHSSHQKAATRFVCLFRNMRTLLERLAQQKINS